MYQGSASQSLVGDIAHVGTDRITKDEKNRRDRATMNGFTEQLVEKGNGGRGSPASKSMISGWKTSFDFRDREVLSGTQVGIL